MKTNEFANAPAASPSPPPTASKMKPGKGETIAKIGAVVSAIVASACCWMPLVLLALGVSGAGIAATLETYRPLFIVVTFGFLAAAFYFTYRPKNRGAEGDCCTTEPAAGAEDCCAPPSTGRKLNMMTLNKVMLWVVTVLAIAFLLFPSYVGALLGTNDAHAVTSDMRRTVIEIEGMTCEGCATTVAKAIRSVPGVQGVTVSYEKRQAIVGTDPAQPVPIESILAALEKAGYSGRFLDSQNGGRDAAEQSSSNHTPDVTDH